MWRGSSLSTAARVSRPAARQLPSLWRSAPEPSRCGLRQPVPIPIGALFDEAQHRLKDQPGLGFPHSHALPLHQEPGPTRTSTSSLTHQRTSRPGRPNHASQALSRGSQSGTNCAAALLPVMRCDCGSGSCHHVPPVKRRMLFPETALQIPLTTCICRRTHGENLWKTVGYLGLL